MIAFVSGEGLIDDGNSVERVLFVCQESASCALPWTSDTNGQEVPYSSLQDKVNSYNLTIVTS